MEVGIPQSLSALEKSFLPTSRLSLESNVLDVKLASTSQFNDKDEEGEIMLLAMILLQLHGVPKLPTVTTTTITTPVITSSIELPAAPASPSSDDESDLGNKKKRQRTSPDQLAILEQIFQTDKMPNPQTRGQLADQLGMSSRRVQIWFQNKRAKVKRSNTKQDDECSSPNSLGDSSASIPPPSPTSASESNSPSPSSPSTPAPAPVFTPITNAISSSSPSTTNSTPSLTVFTSSTTSTTTATSSDNILADTAKQLKAQQLQFSLKAPFIENQPLLAASY